MYKIKIALFSDIHAGDGTAADNFGVKHSKTVINKIKELMANGYQIILLGDIYEAIQFRYHAINKCYPELREIINQVTVIKGNHDINIGEGLGIQTQEEFIIDQRILAYHGYQDDKPINKLIVRIALKCWAVIERIIGRKTAADIDEKISPQDKKYKGDKSEYIQNAFKRGKERGFEIVIIGHTHEPGIWEKDGVKVVNTGTCTNWHLMYATIEENEQGTLIAKLYDTYAE